MKIRNSALITLGFVGSMTAAQAQFVLLDDFESYTAGSSIGAAANWTSTVPAGRSDHTVGTETGNQYLSTASNAPGATYDGDVHSVFNNGSTLLADAATGTFFFRAQIGTGGAHAGVGMGITDALDAGWNDAAGIVRLGNRTDGATSNRTNFYGYNASTYDNLNVPAAVDEWYNVWVVLDNAADTYDVHMQRDGDATVATQTLVGDDLVFRNTTAAATIESIFIRAARDNTFAAFDDLHFAQGSNLANPVPEPSAFALLAGLLGLSVAAVRRRS